MALFDRIYLIFYWSVNKNLNRKGTAIWALNYLVFPILIGSLTFIIAFIINLLKIEIALPFIIITSTLISFFLSEKMIESYYSDDRQSKIIESYPKPGLYRYFLLALLIIVSLGLMVLFALLAGLVYN